MFSNPTKESSLVSVIITCYNHGQYLKTAIESVLEQDYENLEVIVVDDGSTDDTMQVAKKYPNVKYVHQTNQGLSSARNTGIERSNGAYLIFLDADDWLLDDAVSVNLEHLKQNQEAAFVSGGHLKINSCKEVIEKSERIIEDNHYCRFLEGNYIGMHAAVMYRRWILEEFRFDTSLNVCEDYDLYFKISRKYPIIHHTELIAAYHIHDQNMSGNSPLMLKYVLRVLNRQRKFLANTEEEEYFGRGFNYWKDYYCKKSYEKLYFAQNLEININQAKELYMLWKFRRALFSDYFNFKTKKITDSIIEKITPDFVSRKLYEAGIYTDFVPDLGKIKMGDLNRISPFDTEFGYNRGGPVDRYYIENFLERFADRIKGRVLEVGDNEYTLRFGGSKVTQSDILHIDENNPKATFLGDLSNIPHLPTDSFDCIILTQTLQFIYSYNEALETCRRVLKPGGTLLITVPGISQIDQGEWGKYWLWSFTENSIKRLLSEIFPAEYSYVESFGNVLAATAFLYGIGLPEIKKEQMDYNDPQYQLIITAVVVKPK